MQLATNNTVAQQILEGPLPFRRQIGGLARSFGLLGLGAGLLALVPVSAARACIRGLLSKSLATPFAAGCASNIRTKSGRWRLNFLPLLHANKGIASAPQGLHFLGLALVLMVSMPVLSVSSFAQTVVPDGCQIDPGNHPLDGSIANDVSGAYVGTTGECNGLLVVDYKAMYDAGSWLGDGSFRITVGGTNYYADKWYVTNLTNFGYLFYNSNSNYNIVNWDMSNATSLEALFRDSSFNRDIGDWDVSQVTNMRYLFDGTSFNYDISDWDVSSVTTMFQMFRDSSFNRDISDWDVSNVTDMDYMFYRSKGFDQDLSSWDVRHIASEPDSFQRSNSANWQSYDQPKWGGYNNCTIVSNSTSTNNAKSSFHGSVSPCEGMLVINQDDFDSGKDNGYQYELTGIDYTGDQVYTGNVTDMSNYFQDEEDIDFDISGWDTSNVTDMSYMFDQAENFNQSIGGWDISGITAQAKMNYMFRNANKFNQSLIAWDVLNLSEPTGFDTGADAWEDANKPKWGQTPLSLDGSTIGVSADSPTSVIADGVEVINVTVDANDITGEPYTGLTIGVYSDEIPNQSGDTPGLLLSDVVEEEGTGIYTANVASTQQGVASIVATLNGVPITSAPVELTFVAPPSIENSTVESDTSDPKVGSSVTISVQVKDEDGEVVEGYANLSGTVVDANGNAIDDATLGDFSESTQTPGTYTATLTSSQFGAHFVQIYLGAQLIDQSNEGYSLRVDFNGDSDSLDLVNSSISANPASAVPSGNDAVTIEVAVVDTSGVPVFGLSDVEVYRADPGGSPSLAGTATDEDKDGTYTLDLTSTEMQSEDITATVGGDSITSAGSAESVTISFTGDANNISLSGSTIAVDSGETDASSQVVSETETILVTVTVLDGGGYRVAGQSVEVFSDGTSVGTASDQGDGTYTLAISSTVSGEKLISASLNGNKIRTSDDSADEGVTVTFVPGPLDLAVSTVDAAATQAGAVPSANGTDSFDVYVTILDQYGNPINDYDAGLIVAEVRDSEDATITEASLSNFSSPTLDDGKYAATLTSTKAVNHFVTVTLDADLITHESNPVSLYFNGDASNIDLTTSSIVVDSGDGANPLTQVADGISAITVTVTVVDAGGNGVTGQTVAVATTGDFVATSEVTDQGDGTYTATMTTIRAEEKIVSATVNAESEGGGQIGTPVTVTWIAGDPSSSKSSFGLEGSDQADYTSEFSLDDGAPFWVIVEDKDQNPITDLTSSDFLVRAKESSLGQYRSEIGLSDFDDSEKSTGLYKFNVTSQSLGFHIVEISAANVSLDPDSNYTNEVTFFAGSVVAANSTVENTTDNLEAVDPSSKFTLTLADQFGHAVTGLEAANFSWTVKDGSGESAGDITGAALSDVSELAASGVYETTLTSPSSGDHYVRIYVGDVETGIELTDAADAAKVTFVTEPDAPSDFSVAQGDASLTLTWTAPNDNGSAITGYEYSLDKGLSYTATGSTANTFTTPTLTNGTTYEVQVRAINAVDASAASDTITLTPAATNAGSLYDSVTCSPILASDPNVTLTGTPTNSDSNGAYQWAGDLTFTFSSPLDLVLAPHSSSTVANFDDGASYVVDTGPWVQTLGASSITYALNGTTISGAQTDADAANANWGHFDAAGVSSLTLTSGGSDADAVTLCRIPAAPGAPTNLSVTPGDGELTLSWDAPLDDGGPDISAYKYSLDGGSTYTAFDDTDTTQTLSLANGESYTVSVLAVNDVDDGAASAAVTVPSVTLATSVDGVVGGTFTVTATFSEPVTDFDLDDVSVANADKANFAATGTVTTDPDTGRTIATPTLSR